MLNLAMLLSRYLIALVVIMQRIYVTVLLVALVEAAQLPKYFEKCDKSAADMNACITKSANMAWPTVAKGDNKYHIQPMNPLNIPYMHIDVDGNLRANFTDLIVHGLENTKFEDIKMDLNKKHLDIQFICDRLNFAGHYEITGKLLFLPLEGQGPSNITFMNMRNFLSIDFELKEKDGKEYIDIKNSGMRYETTRGYFRLDNLFNGDENLGAAMNKVLDESWEAVNAEVGARCGDALGEVYTQIIQSFCQKVPISEFFSA